MRVLRISHSAVVDAWRERERVLRVRGHRVHLLSARVWNEGGRDTPLAPRPDEDVVGVCTWGRHPALFVYDPVPIWKALRQEWDVIDIHEEPFALATAEILLLRALSRNRAPYVLYSAQNIEKRYPPPFRWLETGALRRAAGVSVCNAAAGRIVERKGLPLPATIIPLGTDLDHFSPGPESGVPDPEVAIRVAYAGRLETHKGVDVLLDAIAEDPRLHLSVAGAGPREPHLRARVSSESLHERVKFFGALGHDDLPGFYRSADVVAVPSLTTVGWVEQFGRVAVEAMACGTPVVASASGALPDVVGHAGILVAPGDHTALREALLRVGLDPGLARMLRASGLRRAAETSWSSVAADYEALYVSATGATPPSAVDAPMFPPAEPTGAAGPWVGSDREGLPPIEVVVVAYGAPDMLRCALTPLVNETVHVVDNSSDRGVRAVCQDLGLSYVDPGRNGGFAAGVNAGLRWRRWANSDVLLLNPDAVIEPAALRQLQRALRAQDDVASVSPRLVDTAGEVTRVSWPYPSPRRAWRDAVGLGGLLADGDFVVGSALLLRSEAIDDVGGFDESFFLYAEETDWAYRATRRGWRHRVVTDVTAVHAGAGTSTDPQRREIHFHAGQERFYRKHYGALGWGMARAAALSGALARSLLPGLRGASARGRVRIYLRGPMCTERAHLPAGIPASRGRPL